MLFILINQTKSGLTEDDYKTLAGMMNGFYDNIPAGVRLVGDYAALDWTKNFAILEADSIEKINALKAPFEKYVNIEVIPVEPTAYFKNMGQK
ncbi:MAG: DUF3303 family protein [Nitrospirae bacterium]|nr:DUF3303 family protein [Nitrospirota bacterium]